MDRQGRTTPDSVNGANASANAAGRGGGDRAHAPGRQEKEILDRALAESLGLSIEDVAPPPEADPDSPEGRVNRLTVNRPVDHAARAQFWAAMKEEPWSFNFFAAVRRIEAMYSDLRGFGRTQTVGEDPLRFSQEPSLAFAPCTLSEFRYATDKAPQRLFVHFMGMLGPNGPLPLHLTEYARERERIHKDPTFARFLDVFNHRAVSLFYRAWAASQMPASFDRWEVPLSGKVSPAEREQQLARDTNKYSLYVGSLFGIGMDSLRHRDDVSDLAKLHYSGRLASHQKSPEGLLAIIANYFKVEADIEEFSGRWTEVPDSYGCRLGVVPKAGRNCGTLGTASGGGAMAGSKVFDCTGAFRLRLGPMSMADYNRLLPGTDAERRLATWIRNYVGDEFWWDAVLILRKEEVPFTHLGKGARLGWTSWVQSKKSPEDRADLALRSRH